MSANKNAKQIIHTAEEYIRQNFEISDESISSETELTLMGLSSLDIISLILHLEELYDIQIPFDASAPLKTINDIAHVITDCLNEKEFRNEEIKKAEFHIFGKEGNSSET